MNEFNEFNERLMHFLPPTWGNTAAAFPRRSMLTQPIQTMMNLIHSFQRHSSPTSCDPSIHPHTPQCPCSLTKQAAQPAAQRTETGSTHHPKRVPSSSNWWMISRNSVRRISWFFLLFHGRADSLQYGQVVNQEAQRNESTPIPVSCRISHVDDLSGNTSSSQMTFMSRKSLRIPRAGPTSSNSQARINGSSYVVLSSCSSLFSC